MKYFIDGGGNKGQSTKAAIKMFPEHFIHVFECSPGFEKFFEHYPVLFHNDAIWIRGGFIDFYKATYSQGSTLIKDKKTARVDYKNPIKVPCLDFSKWLKDTFTKEDEIVLKLNIEGSEIEVLSKMIDDGTINLIDKLYLDNHWKQFGDEYREKWDILSKKMAKLNIQYEYWKA